MFISSISLVVTLICLIIPNFLFKHIFISKSKADDRKSHADYYVYYYIALFFILCPSVMQFFPASYGITSQICLAFTVLLLDWVSLYEDKSRFSEEKLCMFGNCRTNALITGIIAHLSDVIGLAFLLYGVFSSKQNSVNNGKILLILAILIYTVYGCYQIYKLTKEKSESDLRGLSKEDKCKRNRIMKDQYRGVLNLVITFLGIFIGWQSIMEIGNKFSNNSMNIPTFNYIHNSWLKEISKFLKNMKGDSNINRSKSMVNIAKTLFVILTTVVPTYANKVNTAYQYSADPSELKLPKCFD
jgi:hypothetical protein